MMIPTRTALPYTLQVQTETGWMPLCHYDEDRLDSAIRSCHNAVLTEKSACRVIENDNGNIVLEKFYNRDEDREARDWDDDWEEEQEDLGLSWQDDGF